jgi:hypothetical protein
MLALALTMLMHAGGKRLLQVTPQLPCSVLAGSPYLLPVIILHVTVVHHVHQDFGLHLTDHLPHLGAVLVLGQPLGWLRKLWGDEPNLQSCVPWRVPAAACQRRCA